MYTMTDHCPCDGEPVKGCRSAANLIHDHEGAWRGLCQDRSRFNHLNLRQCSARATAAGLPSTNHERGAIAGQVVRCAHAAVDGVHNAERGAGGRHERAYLREDSNECILPQKRALAAHIGSAQQVNNNVRVCMCNHATYPVNSQK